MGINKIAIYENKEFSISPEGKKEFMEYCVQVMENFSTSLERFYNMDDLKKYLNKYKGCKSPVFIMIKDESQKKELEEFLR